MDDQTRTMRGRNLRLVAIFVPLLFSAQMAFAAPPRSSLELVPNDAEIYLSMQRNREQVELIAASRWWAKLKAMPVAQLAWTQAMQAFNKPDGPSAMINQWLTDPENQELFDVGIDLISDEVFVYGDRNLADMMRIYVDYNERMYGAIASVVIIGIDSAVNAEQRDNDGVDEKAKKIVTQALFDPVLKDLAELSTPTLVVGFKSKDRKRTAKQVDRIVGVLQKQLEQESPEVAARLKKTKIAGADFWTLALDGTMLPWDEIEKKFDSENELGLDTETVQQLFDRLKRFKFVVSLGQLHGYLLLSISESTDEIARLGQGDTLLSRAQFAPLREHQNKRITGISFAGKEMVAATMLSKSDIDDNTSIMKMALNETGFDDDVKRQMAADIDEMATDITSCILTPGAIFSFSYLTDRGIESFDYDESENLTLDGSKRLSILNHVGGNPLFMVAGRSVYSPENYATLVKWLKKGYHYIDVYGMPQMDESQRHFYELFTQKAEPLLARLNVAIGSMILPALADGQAALVIDARLTSQKWSKDLPEAEEHLKLIQPAMILGVSDAEKLLKGITECIAIGKSAYREIQSTFAPGEASEDRLPRPVASKSDIGTVYSYPLPKEAGLDERIAPSFGLSESVATFTIAPSHARDLMTVTPFQGTGPLANSDRPLAMAIQIDFASMVDVAMPWIEYIVKNKPAGQPDFDQDNLDDFDKSSQLEARQSGDPQTEMILGMIRENIDLIKVVRAYRSATYVEGKKLVTHRELHLQDLAE